MLSKEELILELRRETKIVKHLAGKLPPGTLEWRPTPGQRSTLELMRYLTTCANVPLHAAIRGNWDDAERLDRSSESVTPESFADAMDAQMASIESLLSGVTEAECAAREAELPWGEKVSLGRAIACMTLKPMVAYRMQFFLYAKQSGNADIGPANCWVGVDAPKR